jgi:hypothetical protein
MHYAACTASRFPRASAAIAAELFEVAQRIVPLEREVISEPPATVSASTGEA